MQVYTIRQLATRAALLLTLGLGACDKALDVQPATSLTSTSGLTTSADALAGLIGCYDAIQATSYDQISYPIFGELIAGNVREVGTFTTTYGYAASNVLAGDNVEIANMWAAIYAAVGRTNYLLQQSDLITDPTFSKATTQAEARALRAYHYMNLLGYWGGSTNGYGYSGGVGVPLRLTPVTDISQVAAVPRSSEADVAAAIRADLDFAVANLPLMATNGVFRVSKNSALALRARFELRMHQYADALKYAQQVPAVSGFATMALATSTATPDALWQLNATTTDKNFMAYYWYPSANYGGRNEFDPATNFATFHPSGDLRLPINVQPTPTGTTAKYTNVASGTDYFNVVRYAEMVLTIAEAAAQTGDLTTALAQDNIIRKRAGLLPLVIGTTPTPAPSPAVAVYITPTAADPTGSIALIKDILLQRRLELAYEGHYWFDLRRTNTIQTALPTYTQTFRNIFPIPTREINLTNGLITQNQGY